MSAAATNDLPLAWRALQANPRVFDSLSDLERTVLAHTHDLWLRPSQIIPRDRSWRYYGHVCGRGWGKSHAIACEINRRVQHGEATLIGLMGPTEERVDDIQAAFLVEVSPPWFKAERYLGGVRWPNGVRALAFSAEEPERCRGDNFDLSWMNEIVSWDPTNARTAFNNITTATRKGAAQVLWDTTTKGRNAVVTHLFERNRENPNRYPIARGSMFDNPTLPPDYIRDEIAKYVPGSRQYREEVLGEFLDETAGALWQQAWLDRSRVNTPPPLDLILVSIDPALSARESADETGLIVGGRAGAREAYILRDHSGHLAVEQWGDIAIAECIDHGAAGIVVERNHLGDNPAYVLRSRARTRGRDIRVLDRDAPFPRRDPAIVWVREVAAVRSKGERARGPASETEAGHVHMVGTLHDLESELTSYEPGQRTSPNRLDALAWLITELLGLRGANDAGAQQLADLARLRLRVNPASRAL